MKELITTNDKLMLLDDEDYDYFNNWNWSFNGYSAQRHDFDRTMLKLHIEIMKRHGLYVENREVDHKDRDIFNCQKYNLRMATRSQNQMNTPGNQYATSQYKGVSWYKRSNKWRASIMKNKYCYNLGYYNTEIEAAKVYNEAAKIMFGEFAYLNPV